jgi:hypothetical protein
LRLRRTRGAVEQALEPVLADAEVVAAVLGVEVVAERPLASVLEFDAHQTGAARDGRGHFFFDRTFAPLRIVAVRDDVTEAQIETKAVRAHPPFPSTPVAT